MRSLARAVSLLPISLLVVFACLLASPLSAPSGLRGAEVIQADSETLVRFEALAPKGVAMRLGLAIAPVRVSAKAPVGAMPSRRRSLIETIDIPADGTWRSFEVSLPQDLVGGTYRVEIELARGACEDGESGAIYRAGLKGGAAPCVSEVAWASEDFDLPRDPAHLAAWLHGEIELDMLSAAAVAAGLPLEINGGGAVRRALGTQMGDWRAAGYVASFTDEELCVESAFPAPVPGHMTACMPAGGIDGTQEYFRRSELRIEAEGFDYPRGVMSYDNARQRAAAILRIDPVRWRPHKVRYISAEPEGYWLFEKTMDRTIAILADGLICREEARRSHSRCAGLTYEICDGQSSEIGECSRSSW